MINKLIEGIFYIITKIFSIIFTPFFTALFTLFPSLSSYVDYVIAFVDLMGNYNGVFQTILFLPSGYLLAIFDYLLIKYSIYLLAISVRFIINVYNKLKP